MAPVKVRAYNLTPQAVPLPGTGVTLPPNSNAPNQKQGIDITEQFKQLTPQQQLNLKLKAERGTINLVGANGLPTVDLAQRVPPGTDDAREDQQRTYDRMLRMTEAMVGDMELFMVPSGPIEVTADALNNAKAGAQSAAIVFQLRNAVGKHHSWANFSAIVTAGESVATPAVGVPSILTRGPVAGEVPVRLGSGQLRVVFDTDSGATKTYAAFDSLTVTVKVSPTSELLGYDVPDAVLTINII